MEPSAELLRVFIGADPRQSVSYNVLQFSIVRRASKPVQITPLIIEQLPISRQGLTPFTYSRFLVPWLCNYQGWAIFMDADMLVLDDIAKLFDYADPKYSILVSKNHLRFEWASVILYNCEKCRNLTPDFIQNGPSGELYGLDWAGGEDMIGAFPGDWNHLVGYDEPREHASLIHYTQGNPMFPEVGACEFSGEWFREQRDSNYFLPWREIMGTSVHAYWYAGKGLPKHRVMPILEQAKEAILNTPFQVETNAENHGIYTSTHPSPRYQQRLQVARQHHLFGIPDKNIPADQYGTGMELFQCINAIKMYLATKEINTMLDYGSGKGMQYNDVFLTDDKQKTYKNVHAMLGLKVIDCYDPAFPLTADQPSRQYDMILSTDYLETCPEDDLPWILDEIFSMARLAVVLKISTWANGEMLYENEANRCTLKSSQQWYDLLKPYVLNYPDVDVCCFLQHADNNVIEDLSDELRKLKQPQEAVNNE